MDGGGTRSVLMLGFHDASHANLKTKIENSIKRGPATGIILGVPSTYPVCLQRVPKCTHNSALQCTRLEVQQCTRVRTTAYTRVHSHKIAEDSTRGKASYPALYSADQSVGPIDYSKKNQENQISVELSISLLAWGKRESGGRLDQPFLIFNCICGIKSHYLLIPFI